LVVNSSGNTSLINVTASNNFWCTRIWLTSHGKRRYSSECRREWHWEYSLW
jgi:hypothetical protein